MTSGEQTLPAMRGRGPRGRNGGRPPPAARRSAIQPVGSLGAGVAFAVNAIAQDGETTWFEGVLLLAVYALLGLALFFML